MSRNKDEKEVRNYRPKKVTTSKVALFLPYLFLIFEMGLLVKMLLPMIKSGEYNYNIIQYFGIEVIIPTVGLCMVCQTTYSIKSKAEYLSNTMIYNVMRMIDIQKDNPEYEIYDTAKAKEDAKSIIQPYKDQISSMDKKVLDETPSSK